MMIVKVPGINGLGKTKNCRNSGNAILKSLDEIYSDEKGKIVNRKLLDLEEIHVNNENLEEQEKLIYGNASELFESHDKVIFLGGDHSISFSIGKAFLDFCKKKEKEACLIVFDAHADCMKPEKNPTHEEWLRALIESGFPKEKVLLVGARNIWKEEIEFLAENKIKRISMNDLNNNLEEITDTIMEFANGKELYLSFDIDVVDSAFIASSYPEPGGLISRQAIYIVSRISRMKNLRAFDIVEVFEDDEKTVKLAGKFLAELL